MTEIKCYSYWRPGGVSGVTWAKSPMEAARKMDKDAIFCQGTDPYVYVLPTLQTEVKLWYNHDLTIACGGTN